MTTERREEMGVSDEAVEELAFQWTGKRMAYAQLAPLFVERLRQIVTPALPLLAASRPSPAERDRERGVTIGEVVRLYRADPTWLGGGFFACADGAIAIGTVPSDAASRVSGASDA